MGPLVLVGFVLLWAGLVLAEVTTDFNNCKHYFYNKIEPQGFDKTNKANICQKYKNEYFFATLYDKSSRIPVWSAYTLREGICQEAKEQWKLEPQLSGISESNMKMLGELNEEFKGKPEGKNLKDRLKLKQAISEDYDKTGFDRGHLNPDCFQSDKGRTATYTLSNAVPMDPCFNRVTWYELERNLKKQLTENCLNSGGKPFLVTGVVPNAKHKIPTKGRQKDPERVVVPSHIWTAVCCGHSDQNQKFSFAFLGENKPDSTLKSMTVTDLDNHLKKLYGNRPIKIFNNDCNQGSKNETEIVEKITEELHSSFPNWDDGKGKQWSQNAEEILEKIAKLLQSSSLNWYDDEGNECSPNADEILEKIMEEQHSSFPNWDDGKGKQWIPNVDEILEKIAVMLQGSFPNWDDGKERKRKLNADEIVEKITEEQHSSFPNWDDEERPPKAKRPKIRSVE